MRAAGVEAEGSSKSLPEPGFLALPLLSKLSFSFLPVEDASIVYSSHIFLLHHTIFWPDQQVRGEPCTSN